MANNDMNFAVDLLPSATNTYNLGNTNKRWKIFANEIDGTIKANNITPILSASFTTGKYGQDGSGTHYYEMLGSITPTSFEQMWLLHYIITIEVSNDTTYTYRADVEIYGVRNTYVAYKIFNSYYSKYPIYQHVILEGASSSYPHEFGYRLASSYGDTTVNKNIHIDIIETRNCTATFFNAPKAYTSSTPSNYTWRTFNATSNGLQESGDADTITRLYAGNNSMVVSSNFRLPGSAIFGFDRDNHAQGISLYSDGYTSTTTSINVNRVYNTAGFDWAKGLFYNTSSNFATGAEVTPGIDQSLHAIDFRYTDNCVNSSSLSTLGLERYKAVYLRGTIGTDGLFYLAPLTVSYNNQNYKRAWTQEIPTSADGYVYWFLGFPYYNSSYAGGYQLNFYLENKLYAYYDGKFQEYIPTISIVDKTSGTLPVTRGGTGATTAADARTNLGLGSMATATETNYVKVDGTRAMTGSLSISKAGECGLEVNNTQTTSPNQVAFIVGQSGNGGIYSRKHSKWIVYSDASGNVVLNGNANTATAFSSNQSVTLTGDVTGSASSTGGWSIATTIGTGKVTNNMLAGSIANGKLSNSKVTIAGTDVSLGSSITADTLRTSLGLSNAMHFLGVTTTNISSGTANTTATVAINDSNVTAAAGDVVLYGSQEYVWGNSKWNLLGDESSYKVKQTAKSDPTASTTTSTTFIDTISQDANGVITATKKTLPSYVPTSAGVTAVTWDSTNNKLTRTINGTAADVVTISTIKTALALTKSDVGLGNVANSTYAGGTAVTLNNSSKASSTASFYAPTTGGTANTQALVGNGATTAPKWVDISPSITIGAGTSSAAPTVNVTVLGQSGTAKSITTASTSVYGVTKLNDGISSSSTVLAATANSALIAAKKVASSNSASKLYLVGATSQSTTGVDSYSFQYTYTKDGLLSALKLGLNLNGTEKVHLEWNNTDQSIDFIFN